MATRSPISILQEIMAQQKKRLPIYLDVPSDLPYYKCRCVVIFESDSAAGYAHTKKDAKHNAAIEALITLGIESDNDTNNTNINNNIITPITFINYVGILNEHACNKKTSYPTYYDKNPQNGRFVIECQYLNLAVEGLGGTKKNAKQMAAQLMLQKMETEEVAYPEPVPQIRIAQSNTENKELIEKVIKQYEKMCVDENPMRVPNPVDTKLPAFQNKTGANDLEEVKERLRELGHDPKLEVFQRDPYILLLKVHKDCCVMGHGETSQEAMDELVYNSNIMFNDDFDFKSHF